MESSHASGMRGSMDASHQLSATRLAYPAGVALGLLKALKNQRDHQEFCDLVLEVRGSQFYAHRNIIAAWSPSLLNQLERGMVQREVAKVNFEDPQIFGQLLEFMYSGYVQLQSHSIVQLLYLACSFQVQALRDLCEQWLGDQLGIGNLMSSFRLAHRYRLHNLETRCVDQLQNFLSETVKQPDFLSLSPAQINSFLSSRLVSLVNPEVKLFMIISWLGHSVREREQYLVMLLKHINWSTVAADFLQEISQTENFFTSNESSLYLFLQTLHSSNISLGPYENAFPHLRQTYSYLLAQVVQGSILPPSSEEEEFHPVTVSISVQWSHQATKSGVDKSLQTTQENSETDHRVVVEESPAPPDTEHDFLSEGEGDGEKMEAVSMEAVDTPADPDIDSQPSLLPDASNSQQTVSNIKTRGRKKAQPQKIPPLKLRKTNAKKQRGKGTCTRGTRETRSRHSATAVPRELTASTNAADSERSGPVAERPQRESAVRQNKGAAAAVAGARRDASPEEARRRGRPRKKLELHYCDSCEYHAFSANRLLQHKERIHDSGHQYHCNLCDSTFHWNKKYYLHMRNHFPGPPYQCEAPGCQYTSERIQTLLNHRIKHSDQRPYPCPKCDLRFRTKPNLHAHLKCHTGARPFACPVCHRTFATKNTAEQHLVTHSDHRPYLCDTCGFSTKFQSHLIAHKRIHTGEVFRCQFPQCTYFTPKRSQLSAHMRSHLGIRRHVCSTCGKAFVEKSHLVRHERLHTDDKPYQCNQCDYASTRVDKLKEHMEKHHGEAATASPSKQQAKSKPRRRRARPEVGPPTQVALPHPPGPLPPPPSGEGSIRPSDYYLGDKADLYQPTSSSAADLPPVLAAPGPPPPTVSAGMELQPELRERELTVLQAALSVGPTVSAHQPHAVAVDSGGNYILTSIPASSAPSTQQQQQQDPQEFGLQSFMTMIPHF